MRQSFRVGINIHLFYFPMTLILASSLLLAQTQDEEVMDLVDKVIQRQSGFYLRMDNWEAIITTINTKMNKHWQPKEVTVVKKKVQVVDMHKSEELLEATKTKNGIPEDVTEEYIKKAREQKEKSKKKELQQNLERRKARKENNKKLKAEDLLPFSEKKKMKYLFSKLADSTVGGRPVYVVEARAKVKSEKRFSGYYYISKDTHDILRINAWPSKNPRFVKELDIEIDLDVYPQGFYAIKRSKIRVNGGFLFIKKVRRVTEEEYSDFTVLDDPGKNDENPEL